MPEQPELPLEMPKPSYVITVSRGPIHGEVVLRTTTVTDALDAAEIIESYSEFYTNRAYVTWDGEETNESGYLYGLDPEGESYVIQIAPPLAT